MAILIFSDILPAHLAFKLIRKWYSIFVPYTNLLSERGNNLPLSECIATCYDYIIIASGYGFP